MNNRPTGSGFSRRWFYWWADHPALHIVVLLVMSSASILGHVYPDPIRDLILPNRLEEESSGRTRSMSDPNRRNDRPAPDVEPFRVAGGEVVLVATSPDFFSSTGLTAIRKVVDDLEELPQVTNVLWLDSIPELNLFGLTGSLLPNAKSADRVIEAARERAVTNPLAVGQLVSPDGETFVLSLSLDWFYVTTDEAATTEIRETAEAAAASIPGADIQFQVTGPAPLYLMNVKSHLRDSIRYQAIGYSIMILAAIILFRGLSAVIIVAISPAVGVFWTMGMLHFFDLQDNPFNDMIVPIMISLVGLTDAVHLMVEIRNQRASGLDTKEAARRGLSRVGPACFLTSLTTAIGFASLVWAHHEVVRQFGWCCVLGVIMTFISVVTVVPLGCRSPLGRRLHVGLGKSLIDGQIKRIGSVVDWVLGHDRMLARVAIVATVVLAAVCLRLQPDEKRYSGLSSSGEAAQALRHLDTALGGLELGNVSISWGDDVEDTELVEVLQDVDQMLAAEPLLGHPLGMYDLLEALPGDGPVNERMPLLELLPASLKRAFYQPERQTSSIQFRVQDLGIARYGPVFERLEAGMANIVAQHPDFYLELDGDAVWRWRHIYRILTDLATSLGTASVIIWLVLTVVYRSIRIGLISIVPNLFPLAFTGAMLYFSGQYLELATVCVFTICIGIAVDDTIHFLTRCMEEKQSGDDQQEVIHRAFTGVGSALLMTTIVLVAGMLTALWGDARDARLFGMMGALTLTAALFADVLFLPALLNRFAAWPSREEEPAEPPVLTAEQV